MDYAAIIILVSLIQYTYFSFAVGAARGKYKVTAPATKGDELWERVFRVQQNTLEQLVAFIPATLAFSFYVGGLWVLLPGITFLVGRQVYSYQYINDPESRTLGFLLTFAANMVLIFGSLIAVIIKLMA